MMIMTMLLRLIVVIIKRFPTKDCNGYFTLALTERHELNTAMDPCQVKRDPLVNFSNRQKILQTDHCRQAFLGKSELQFFCLC